ncbi:MAG: hypothetical protein ACMXYG_05995 [Candidatus Woesearchaeota archaeon]
MKNVFYTLILTLFSKPVLANPGMQEFLNVFNTGGVFLEQLLTNDYAVFGITVIIFTIMFYNIFVPLMGKIPVFSGSPTNKYGKIVSLCLAILSSLGIFGLIFLNGGAVSVSEALDSILGPYAILGGILLSLLIFAMTYFGLKDADPEDDRWKKALIGAALTMIFYGWLMGRRGSPLFALGWLITFVWLAMWMFRKKGGDSGDGSGSDSGDGSGSGSGGGSGGGSDGKGAKGKVTLIGKVLNDDNEPVSTIVEALDSSGNTLARARSNGVGNFAIVIKDVEDKEVVVDVVIANNDPYWNSYNGHNDHRGKKPPFKIKKNKTIKGIVVSKGDKSLDDYDDKTKKKSTKKKGKKDGTDDDDFDDTSDRVLEENSEVALLKVHVKNEDNENVQGAMVSVTSAGYKYPDQPTDTNGVVPSDDYYILPVNKNVFIDVTYDLSKDEKYKSRNKVGFIKDLFTNKKLKFEAHMQFRLPSGYKGMKSIQLNFKSEDAWGFEPSIHHVKFEDLGNGNKKIKTKGEISSHTRKRSI